MYHSKQRFTNSKARKRGRFFRTAIKSSPTKPKERYEGVRIRGAVVVTVNGQPLNPRFDLWNHNPTGFEWGYAGSGPAQLALASLADVLGDDDTASRLHQDFKRAVVVRLDHDGWTLTREQILQTIKSLASL